MMNKIDFRKISEATKKIISKIVEDAKKEGRTIRVLKGNDIIDIYPNGEEKIIKTLPEKKPTTLKSHYLKLK